MSCAGHGGWMERRTNRWKSGEKELNMTTRQGYYRLVGWRHRFFAAHWFFINIFSHFFFPFSCVFILRVYKWKANIEHFFFRLFVVCLACVSVAMNLTTSISKRVSSTDSLQLKSLFFAIFAIYTNINASLFSSLPYSHHRCFFLSFALSSLCLRFAIFFLFFRSFSLHFVRLSRFSAVFLFAKK